MRSKTIINSKGEPQATRIEIPIKGAGGALGMQAVKNLTLLIDRLKYTKTEFDVFQHYYTICGYIQCCRDCGFLTGDSPADMMKIAEHLVDNELIRVRAEGKGGQE